MNSIPDDANAPNRPGWLKGHPIIDPRHNAAVHFQRPDDAAGVREQIVLAAIDAIFEYSGPIRRDRAVNILKGWRRFDELTPGEVDAVVDSYPAPKPDREKSPKPGPTTNRHGI